MIRTVFPPGGTPRLYGRRVACRYSQMRCANFPVGKALNMTRWLETVRRRAGWKARDTADKNVCATAGRRAFAQRLEGRRREDLGEENRRIERGWFVGDAEFRQELLEPVVPVPGTRHCGEAVQAAVAVQAERLVQDRLQALGWQEEDLTTRRKGDPAKVKLAAVVRAQTIMPLAWIAKRLAMGSRGYLTWLLYRQAKPS